MSWRQSTFAIPLVIGLLSLLGLFCALLGDGLWDWVAWLGLGIPSLLGCWPLVFRPRKPSARRGG